MKLILPLSLIVPCVVLAVPDNEREFNRLGDEREKASKAALEPIDRRYRAGLEALLKRATQAGELETALKIRQALEKLGEGSTGKAVGAHPADLVGSWEIASKSYRGDRVLKKDGSVSGSSMPAAATWSVEDGQLKITYGDRISDTFQLPVRSGRLTGTNTEGTEITLTKIK